LGFFHPKTTEAYGEPATISLQGLRGDNDCE